jgi:capsular exopolysaccharide synthesis family protein
MSKNYEILRNRSSQESVVLAQPVRSTPPPLRTDATSEVSGWLRGVSVLKKYWVLSTFFAVCALAGVAVVTFFMTPIYESTAVIEVDPPGAQAFSIDGRAGGNEAEYLETEAKKLESTQLALHLIRTKSLDRDPDFVGPSNAASPNTTPDNHGTNPLSDREKAALANVTKGRQVRRETSSRLITVSFASPNPRIAAEVANGLVAQFIEDRHKVQHDAIAESSSWLLRQLDDVQARVQQANAELVNFQNRTGIVGVDSTKSTLAERMSELDRQLAQAEGERIQLEAFLNKAEGNADKLPQVVDNPIVQQLTQKLGDARTELAQAELIYGQNHPAIKKLRTQADQLQSELEQRKRAIMTQLTAGYAASRSREHMLEGKRNSAVKEMATEVEYNTLRKKIETETNLYSSLYARIKEAGIAAASLSNNVRVVEPARILDHPTRPDVPANLALGLLAGIFGGVFIAFIREAFENRIHTTGDIQTITGVPSVSVVPKITGRDTSRSLMTSNPLLRLIKRTEGDTARRLLLDRYSSVEGEAFRGMYTDLMLSTSGALPQLLLVTSACPREGKTTVASNLAVALSRRAPTCLVDADLRKPDIAETFRTKSACGLSDLLANAAELKDAITQVPEIPNLKLLGAGTRIEDTGDLLNAHTMSAVLDALRARFEFVVIDSPPILSCADGRVLSTMVGGIIFVGRYCATTREAFAKSIELLTRIHSAPILDFVLNGASESNSDYRYYRYYHQQGSGRRHGTSL